VSLGAAGFNPHDPLAALLSQEVALIDAGYQLGDIRRMSVREVSVRATLLDEVAKIQKARQQGA